MGGPTPDSSKTQRSGTSFGQTVILPSSPPPVSSSLPTRLPDERGWVSETWDRYVAEPFRENIAEPFERNVVNPIRDNIIRPLWNWAEQAVEGVVGHPYAEARGRRHLGRDVACPVGTPVRALGDCRVIRTHEHNGYGPLVVVDYGHGILGTYAHNSRIVAEVGQRIERGGLLSLSGNEGTSSGPHVHEEMLVQGSDGRYYACAPDEVRELAMRGQLNTQEQRDTFIQSQADAHWNGNKERMVPLLSDTYARDMQQYAMNSGPDRAMAASAPTPTPVG
ncbi:MAG: M23 family metallopeptidase [Pseudobdellovibrionaceae bacterium]